MTRQSRRLQTSDYIDLIFDAFLELHGDRRSGDDSAVIGGLARLGERKVVAIGYRRDEVAEAPDAAGYRKCSRLARLAKAFGKPVVLFVHVPESSSLTESELQVDGAMARNLEELSCLATPIVGVITRESSDLRAIGMCAADRVLMLESAAPETLNLNAVDRTVAESPGDDPKSTANALREAILEELGQLTRIHPEVLIQQRLDRLQHQFLNFRTSGLPSGN